mmetsp:Transcript_32424/g.76271  ORF Transcript_32424/g.76271 Transcript_32424/m.76271 type:complete len:370 (-) Transcript_32424:985-2094(-)
MYVCINVWILLRRPLRRVVHGDESARAIAQGRPTHDTHRQGAVVAAIDHAAVHYPHSQSHQRGGVAVAVARANANVPPDAHAAALFDPPYRLFLPGVAQKQQDGKNRVEGTQEHKRHGEYCGNALDLVRLTKLSVPTAIVVFFFLRVVVAARHLDFSQHDGAHQQQVGKDDNRPAKDSHPQLVVTNRETRGNVDPPQRGKANDGHRPVHGQGRGQHHGVKGHKGHRLGRHLGQQVVGFPDLVAVFLVLAVVVVFVVVVVVIVTLVLAVVVVVVRIVPIVSIVISLEVFVVRVDLDRQHEGRGKGKDCEHGCHRPRKGNHRSLVGEKATTKRRCSTHCGMCVCVCVWCAFVVCVFVCVYVCMYVSFCEWN